MIVDLLDLTGRWTAAFYREVDPDALGEPVGLFAAKDTSPYWQIAAREYLERWIHQHQIRRATKKPNLGHAFLTPAAEVVASSLRGAQTNQRSERSMTAPMKFRSRTWIE